jgi:hypothetical protein
VFKQEIGQAVERVLRASYSHTKQDSSFWASRVRMNMRQSASITTDDMCKICAGTITANPASKREFSEAVAAFKNAQLRLKTAMEPIAAFKLFLTTKDVAILAKTIVKCFDALRGIAKEDGASSALRDIWDFVASIQEWAKDKLDEAGRGFEKTVACMYNQAAAAKGKQTVLHYIPVRNAAATSILPTRDICKHCWVKDYDKCVYVNTHREKELAAYRETVEAKAGSEEE